MFGLRSTMLVALCSLSLTAAEASAADAKATASQLARELAEGLKSAAGAAPGLVMLGELRQPKGDGEATALVNALATALVKEQGLRLVDRASVTAALNEAALGDGASDGALAEIAGAFGAQAVIVGSIDKSGADYHANLRAVATGTGAVLASAKASFAAGGAEISTEARTLEAQLRRLSDRLRDGLDRLPGELRYQRIAVLPFETVGPMSQEKQLGLLVASELTTYLRRDHGLMMVERSALAKVMEELALGQTGVTDPSQTAEVGKLAGAQGLIVGSVSDAGDRYLVSARVVSVESGTVEVAEETHLPAADLIALSSEAVVLRTRSGSVFRSVLLPGWAQFYNREPVKGTLFLGTEVFAAGAAVAFHLMGMNAEDRYKSSRDPTKQNEFIDEAENNYRLRNVSIALTIAIHAANILDAVLSGKTYDTAMPSAGTGVVFGF